MIGRSIKQTVKGLNTINVSSLLFSRQSPRFDYINMIPRGSRVSCLYGAKRHKHAPLYAGKSAIRVTFIIYG